MSKSKKTPQPPPSPASADLTDNQVNLIRMMATSLPGDLVRSQHISRDNKDINKACGYPDVVTVDDCWQMFSREGIAKRVVNIFPKESWKKDPEIIETEEDRDTPFELSWKALVAKHNVYHILQRADILSGVGTFGVLLLGLSDKLPLDQAVPGLAYDELGEISSKANCKLLYMRALDETMVQVTAYEKDPTSWRYGMPTEYSIKFAPINSTTSSLVPSEVQTTTKVHWHRIIHLADNRENSELFGEPRLKPVINRIYDLRKVLSGSGEMFWKGGFPGLSFEVDPNLMKEAEFDKVALKAEMKDYSDGLQRYLAMVGVSVKSLAPQVADPASHFTTHVKAIGISLGCPYRIFMGTEEAQLAGSQDASAWNEILKDRQLKYITPMIISPFIWRMVALGCIKAPEDKEKGFIISWPDLHTHSATDKANVAKTLTDAMTTYVQSGGSTLMTPKDFLMYVLEFSAEQATAILKAVEEYGVKIDGGGDGHVHDPENGSTSVPATETL